MLTIVTHADKFRILLNDMYGVVMVTLCVNVHFEQN